MRFEQPNNESRLIISDLDLKYPCWVFFEETQIPLPIKETPVNNIITDIHVVRQHKAFFERFWEICRKNERNANIVSFIPSEHTILPFESLANACICSHLVTDFPYLIGFAHRSYVFLEKLVDELEKYYVEVKDVIVKNLNNFYNLAKQTLANKIEALSKIKNEEDLVNFQLNNADLFNYKLEVPQQFSNIAMLAVNNTVFVVPSVNQYPRLHSQVIIYPNKDFNENFMQSDDFGFIYDMMSGSIRPIDQPGIPIATNDWCVTKIWNMAIIMALIKDLFNLVLSYVLLEPKLGIIGEEKGGNGVTPKVRKMRIGTFVVDKSIEVGKDDSENQEENKQ
jgi:hypothetical protein